MAKRSKTLEENVHRLELEFEHGMDFLWENIFTPLLSHPSVPSCEMPQLGRRLHSLAKFHLQKLWIKILKEIR